MRAKDIDKCYSRAAFESSSAPNVWSTEDRIDHLSLTIKSTKSCLMISILDCWEVINKPKGGRRSVQNLLATFCLTQSLSVTLKQSMHCTVQRTRHKWQTINHQKDRLMKDMLVYRTRVMNKNGWVPRSTALPRCRSIDWGEEKLAT